MSQTGQIEAERTQPEVAPASAVDSSNRLDAGEPSVKGAPQRRSGRKVTAREPGPSISADGLSPASSEKTARIRRTIVKNTSPGEGEGSWTGSDSRKRAPMSPASKPADKRGRKLLSSGDESSALYESAKEESDVGVGEPVALVSPSKRKQSERSDRSSVAPTDKPLHISLPHSEVPASRPLPIPKEIPDAPERNQFVQIASGEQLSNTPVPVGKTAISDSASTASGSAAVGQMATSRPEFVFQDPDSKPPPPIPEGHKLVHIVRHCRAWHKY